MESSLPIEIAETIQTAHINRAPSPSHDINPSTAASEKEPVSIQTATRRNDPYSNLDDGDDDEDVPYSIVKPRRRSANLPPMPDLRFEQSYLNSISKADTWGKVAWITVRDQVRFYLDLELSELREEQSS
jgi:autophagy-related ATG43-like protein